MCFKLVRCENGRVSEGWDKRGVASGRWLISLKLVWPPTTHRMISIIKSLPVSVSVWLSLHAGIVRGLAFQGASVFSFNYQLSFPVQYHVGEYRSTGCLMSGHDYLWLWLSFLTPQVLITKLRSANTAETRQYRKASKALLVLIPLFGLTYLIVLYGPNEGMGKKIFDIARALLLSTQVSTLTNLPHEIFIVIETFIQWFSIKLPTCTISSSELWSASDPVSKNAH